MQPIFLPLALFFAIRGGPTIHLPDRSSVMCSGGVSLFSGKKELHARVACVFFERALHILLH
jgi:hypothetical protein